MNKIIFIEPDFEGHHEFYLLSFIETCLKLEAEVVLITKKRNKRLLSILKKEKFYLSDIRVEFINYITLFTLPQNVILKKLVVIINFFITICNMIFVKRALKNNLNTSVFFCCIDSILHDLMPLWLFDFIFSFKWNALTLISNDSKPISFLDRRRLFTSYNCLNLYYLGVPGNSFRVRYSPKIYPFPDFADDVYPDNSYDLINSIMVRAKGRIIVSLVGALSFRKGIFTLIDTIGLLDSNRYFFVIAGAPYISSNDVLKIKRKLDVCENCLYYFERIPSEGCFNALLEQSSIIYAAYINFPYSSNMLAKACLFKKKLIVSEGGYMSMIVEKYNLGIVIDGHLSEQAASAIEQLSQSGCEISSDFDTYLKFNSKATLYPIFNRLLNEA